MKEDLVAEEASLAGTPSSIGPDELMLDSYRVTSQTEVEEEQFLYRHLGKRCFPRKELTAVTGPAKSGKTFFISQVTACGASKQLQLLSLERTDEQPLKVMLYDTEQSQSTTKEILCQRIAPMIGGDFPEELLFVFNVRTLSAEERRKYLAVAITTYQPDLVVVDGIADLVNDINDGQETVEMIQELMHLAEQNNCNITTVIHLSRTGDKSHMRGWLGTLLLQKCYEVFCCASLPNSETLSVEMTTSRKSRTMEIFYYNVDEKGIPYAAKDSDIHAGKSQRVDPNSNPSADTNKFNKKYLVPANGDGGSDWEWDYRQLFVDAMGGWEIRSADDIETRVKELTNIKQKQYYYKVLIEAERRGVIIKTYDKYHRVAIMLSH